MKNRIIYSLSLIIALFFSCEKEDINSKPSNINNLEQDIVYDYKSELKRDFAKALVQALEDNENLRSFIKKEALKMFDKDYDILYQLVKDETISDSKSFRDILTEYFDDNNKLIEIEDNLPLLTIFVPKLPENSFSAEIWNTETETPEVAIRMTTTNNVPMFTSDNREYILKGGDIPAFPVVVIKENERLIVNASSISNKGIYGSTLKNPKSIIEFRFLDDVFNNTSKEVNNTKSNPTARVAINLDQKLIDAYNIYKNADGWQRDYIYYNLTPTNTKDQFQYDFQEHITQFSMNGDALAAYNKISDQTGDPTFIPLKNSASASSWTGGNFEFKVKILLNAKNGIGAEIVTYFSANAEQLFNATYRKHLWFYLIDDISLKSMDINLPLFNWDLNQYASSIKIEIEEVDLTVTTVLTDTRSVKFANNFSIDPTDGILKKVGLKFGSSLETNTTQTIQKTFTQGNDQLGSVIINFADDVVLNHSTSNNQSTTRDYQTGWYKISFEPKRVQ